MRAIDADELKKCVLKWLPQDPCGKQEKEMPFETDICVSMLMEIDEQPTIQPEPHWIQVTERLPDKFDYYLVCGNNSVWLARYESGRFWGVLSGHALDTVIAWMPLPEVYKEVEE